MSDARLPVSRRRSQIAFAALIVFALLVPTGTVSAGHPGDKPSQHDSDKAVFFASDGLRQDLVEKYAAKGLMPTMREFLKDGISATNAGLLTQAPPNTGAGWYSLATGAWPGVHGSTNNTFFTVGQSFTTARTAAFDPGVLQVESIAQSAERGGLKVAQFEWAGGRNASIQGPTVDFQSFHSGRGVATNFIGGPGDPLFDDAPFIASFGLQFDHPDGYAGRAPFAEAAPAPATGWSGALPATYSPPMEMRLRVLDGTNPTWVDKYGLNAWIFDSKNDGATKYDKVLFSKTKSAADSVGILRKGQWADVKVTIDGGALAGKTAGMLIKVEELTGDLSRVRLFHTSVTRAIASWPTWGGATGFPLPTDFDEFLAQKFPTSTAADFAILEAGVVSEDTYVQQGLYWSTGHVPMLKYIAKTYKPDLLMVGMPTTDEFQHQFLGLVSKTLPNGAPNPAYDDVDLGGVPDDRVAAREGYIRSAYKESDAILTLARSLVGRDPTTFVASDHGFAPQFLAIDASQPLIDLGLLTKPQVSNCRTAADEPTPKAKACWAGGTVQIYLNVGTNAATQIPAAQVAATVDAIKAKFLSLTDPNDWTHDSLPEGWKVIDRVYSRAEARYIPNGAGSTADMAHPTRTGDVVVFSYPPYQFDAATPGTLISFSHFFGQHGYVPDVQDLPDNINMRATFLAGGKGIAKGKVTARSIDLAPTLAFMLGIPEPQYSQGKVLLNVIKGGSKYKPITLVGLNDFHGQLSPTTTTIDGQTVPVGGAAQLATLFDEDLAGLPGPGLILAGGDNVGASPPNSALLEDAPAIDVENLWGLDATSYGNHEFDFGLTRLLAHQADADFPFLATNIVDAVTGATPAWVTPSVVFNVNGTKVGVIGAGLLNTPELVSASNTAGLTFLPEGPRIKAESNRLRKLGVKVQIVVIHQGTNFGVNPLGNAPGVPWVGPILDIASELQDTTVDAMVVGHTHRVSNVMVGDILVTEGINAGATYSVLQLMVKDGDVAWAGGATRLAKNIGVAQRADVKAVVDAANTAVAPILNLVLGDPAYPNQTVDIKRAPTRLFESAMGNLVADAMRAAYPTDPGDPSNLRQAEAAYTNSGGLRADINCAAIGGTEQPCQITMGEMFAVLPFGNATVIETLTGAQMKTAFINGFTPFCNPAFAGGTGRFPQISGLKVVFSCIDHDVNPATPKIPQIDGLWKTPDGPGGPQTAIGDADPVRFVTNDFMYTGGDGYTVFTLGTDVLGTGDLLLNVAADYVADNQPVSPTVDGRILGPLAP